MNFYQIISYLDPCSGHSLGCRKRRVAPSRTVCRPRDRRAIPRTAAVAAGPDAAAATLPHLPRGSQASTEQPVQEDCRLCHGIGRRGRDFER